MTFNVGIWRGRHREGRKGEKEGEGKRKREAGEKGEGRKRRKGRRKRGKRRRRRGEEEAVLPLMRSLSIEGDRLLAPKI